MHARIALSLALGVLAANAGAAETVRWQSVSADDLKVGQALITRSESPEGIVESDRVVIQLGKSSRRVTYRMNLDTESAPDGALRRMAREVETREGHSRIEARAVGADLEVSHGIGRTKSTKTLAGAARGLKSMEAAREWLAAVGRGEQRPPFTFRSWDPVKMSVVEVELTMWTRGVDMNVARRVRSARDTTASLFKVDAHGVVVHETMRLASYELEFFDTSEAEARKRNEVFDHVTPLLQKSPYRIPARDMQQKIRYRFDNHGKNVTLPSGAGQRTWTDDQATWMQVCANCPMDSVELSAEERAQALQPSLWLESADPRLVKLAHPMTANLRDPDATMRRLTTFVRGHMGTQIDMLGYGTALEALRTRRGDCTEFAVLLAALGRAAGVPTRIAIGRVYARHFEGARHVFVPHAWVQAWTGKGWESFDAAIGTFDSTHLAFAVSYDGNPVTHFEGITLSREMTLAGAARVVPRKEAAAEPAN